MQVACVWCGAQNRATALRCVACERPWQSAPSLPSSGLPTRNPPAPLIATMNPPALPLPPSNPPFPGPPVAASGWLEVIITEPGQAPKTLHFPEAELIIGRVQAGTHIVLPKGVVSRRHCRIFMQRGEVYIEDLRTANGTYLNQIRLSAPHRVSESDRIGIGEFVLQLRKLSVSPPLPLEPVPVPTNPPPAVLYSFEVSLVAPNQPAQRLVFQQEQLVVGRAKSSDISIQNSNVSRKHTRFFVRGGALFVEDLNTTNGTFVNGHRLQTAQLITSADQIVIDETSLHVRVSGAGLGVQPPLAPAKAAALDPNLVLGEAFVFLLPSFFQTPALRWVSHCIGLEQLTTRVFSRLGGGVLSSLPNPPPAVPRHNPKRRPEVALHKDHEVLIAGRFFAEGSRAAPLQLKLLAEGTLQLQVLQELSAVEIVVTDDDFPHASEHALDPSTAPHPEGSDRLYQAAQKFFSQGKLLEARAVFEEARSALTAPHPCYAYDIARCYARQGEHALAIFWLRASLQDGWREMEQLRQDAALAVLRDDPRFEALFSTGQRAYHFAQLHAGDTLRLGVFPSTSLACGAFVGGVPWESWVSLTGLYPAS